MRKLTLTVLALVLTPLSAWAQAPKDSWENLKQLKPGHKIKVVDTQLKSWDGKFVSVSGEAITFREKQQQQEITIQRGNVRRVTDLQRSQRGRNALIGAIAGALVTAAVVTREGSGDPAEHAFAGAIFIGIGAGLGAAIPNPRPAIYKSKKSTETVQSDAQK